MNKEELEKKREEIKNKSINVPLTSEQVYSVVCAIKIARDMDVIGVVKMHAKIKEGMIQFLDITNKSAKEQLGITDEMLKGMRDD
jgi:hypothetical protein